MQETKNKFLMNLGKNVSKLSRDFYLGEKIDELEGEPSALEFMRYVALNKPFIIRNYKNSSYIGRKWSNEYLKEKMRESDPVTVAITPNGYADSIVESEGQKVFTLPFETRIQFDKALDIISSGSKFCGKIYYLQTQNDCLKSEYASLLQDIETEISWASEALNRNPDAVNFWMGNELNVTSFHKDNYENIYLVIRGCKRFTLYPPTDCILFPPSMYKTYRYNEDMELVDLAMSTLWYPSTPTDPSVKPFIADVYAGDLIYLPALFYHKVEQIADENGLCIAVNYWYDMEFDMKYCWTSALDFENRLSV